VHIAKFPPDGRDVVTSRHAARVSGCPFYARKRTVRIAKFIEVRTSPLSLGRLFLVRLRIANALERDVDRVALFFAQAAS
jgi:hypothetical protein